MRTIVTLYLLIQMQVVDTLSLSHYFSCYICLLRACHITNPNLFPFFFSFNIRSGLIGVVVLFKLNSKFQTNLALLFSKTCPLTQFSLYHFFPFPTNPYAFAHAIAITINALLCRATYSLLAIVFHQATRCSTVSLNSQHSRHLPFSISPLVTFHPLVSTICSITVIIDVVFLDVILCFN